MYVKDISIKNYRCFNAQGVNIQFDTNTTAVIGKNGAGKTSIIEALHLLFGQEYIPSKISERDFHFAANGIKDEIEIIAHTHLPFFCSIDAVADSGRAVRVLLACDGIKLTIKRREKAERVLDDPFIINKSLIPIEGKIDQKIFDGKYSQKEYPILSIKQSAVEYFNVGYLLKDGQPRYTRIFKYQLAYNPSKLKSVPITYYLDKNRQNEVTGQYSLMNKILTDIHWRYKKLHNEEDEEKFIQTYNSLSTILRSVDNKQILVKTINEVVNKITSKKHSYNIDFLDLNQPYKSSFLSKYEGSTQLYPSNLGSGYQILLSYALLKYVSDLENQPVILLIDEPELHLHSDWQQKLLSEFVGDQKIQTIYSTQSEHFVSLKNWSAIRRLNNNMIFPSREKLDEVVGRENGLPVTVEKCLNEYADRNLHISAFLKENLELFFTDKCILVEGPAEKYALPILLNLIGRDVSKISLSIIPVWGKQKLKLYQLLCKAYGINYFTLYDCDKSSDDESNSENNAIKTNSIDNQVFSFSTSFENKMGIGRGNKFQKLVSIVDSVRDINSLDIEVKSAIEHIKEFVRN